MSPCRSWLLGAFILVFSSGSPEGLSREGNTRVLMKIPLTGLANPLQGTLPQERFLRETTKGRRPRGS
jgi:hypothetical protein